MKLVVLLAAAVVATPVEQSPESSPLVQAARDSKTLPEAAEVAEAGADREGKCKRDILSLNGTYVDFFYFQCSACLRL